MTDLQGLAVLVTRPEPQAAGLCVALERAGARALPLPTLAIKPIKTLKVLDADIIIFTSTNAVNCGVQTSTTLEGVIIAVGPGTQQALSDKGFESLLPDAPYQSESVLALPQCQDVTGKKVLIVAGIGGRELMVDVLVDRGAEVEKIAVYERVKPAIDAQVLARFWRNEAKVITITSVSALENLIAMVPENDRRLLWQTPLMVVGNRQADVAHALHFEQVWVSPGASHDEIVKTLCHQCRAIN